MYAYYSIDRYSGAHKGSCLYTLQKNRVKKVSFCDPRNVEYILFLLKCRNSSTRLLGVRKIFEKYLTDFNVCNYIAYFNFFGVYMFL